MIPRPLLPSLFAVLFGLLQHISVTAQQHSAAREWNEALLHAIRNDFARPPIHARNLFQVSAVMYDAWAAYDMVAEPYLLGKTLHGFTCPFNGIAAPADAEAAREKAISYAAYRLLRHRFESSPGAGNSLPYMDALMAQMGYDIGYTSTDYATNEPAALGNYIAQQMIAYGMQDGSNELMNYANQLYVSFNPTLAPAAPGAQVVLDPNRWQPLSLNVYIDQAGNVYPISTPPHLCPEWGFVAPFALTEADKTVMERDGIQWPVYHDPGTPCMIDPSDVDEVGELYKWNFNLVNLWQSHLDPSDGVMWDISPASIGNITYLPTEMEDYPDFYDTFGGGTNYDQGHAVNPATGLPYAQQVVPRGDYARVLAEFWADGPESETPPGHWYSILNKVSDHPLLEKRIGGQGPVVNDLEWDVKSYLALGGAVHDAAITAWGIKGYYDYVRPISAIRWMSGMGQGTDTELANYHPAGLPLIPGLIEAVGEDDPLAQDSIELVGKIKLFTWRGPDYITDPGNDMAGVGWILAERWYPYQRPTFVTPPFAGYISGHSTFSRSAAELMTSLTGDPFFPGGMGEFPCPQNDFLVFEQGPSVDITLQWATYRDASDQCSLSRIWGGIHPPMDDIPGRLIGQAVGPAAFQLAKSLFDGTVVGAAQEPAPSASVNLWPNPVSDMLSVSARGIQHPETVAVVDVSGRTVARWPWPNPRSEAATFRAEQLPHGIYTLRVSGGGQEAAVRFVK